MPVAQIAVFMAGAMSRNWVFLGQTPAVLAGHRAKQGQAAPRRLMLRIVGRFFGSIEQDDFAINRRRIELELEPVAGFKRPGCADRGP